MTDWIELIDENRAELEQALFEARKRSYLEFLGIRDENIEVAISEDGIISTYYIGNNETAGGVHQGTEISVARFKVMNDFNYDYTPIFEYLTEEEKTDFETWCKENDEIIADKYIEDWDDGVYERIMQEAIKDLFDDNEDHVQWEIDIALEETETSLMYRQEDF